MTVPLTGLGGLFTRLGRMGGLLNAVNAFRGTANLSAASIVSIGTGIDNLYAQFASTDQDLTTMLYSTRDSYRGVHGSLTSYLQGLAQAVLIRMVDDDSPLSQKTLPVALALLISQMKTAAASVPKPTCSTTPSAGGSNTGGGVLVATTLAPNGIQQDYVFNGTLNFTCTSDGQVGATAGQEPFSVAGQAAESDPLMWDWPLGSGASTSLSACDALQNISGGNLLNNSAFTGFTVANTPDNWTIQTGSAGSSIFQATGSNVYKGASGLAFLGNGSELTSIYQPFNVTTNGTTTALTPLTQYAVNLFLKVSSVPAAGVLEIALTDGSGNIVQDANGVDNKITKSLPAATTSFASLSGFFRTPIVAPSNGYRLRIRLSTALTNAISLYLGHLGLTQASQLYTGGPFASLFSGTPNFISSASGAADTFSLLVANNYSSGWQKLFERLFSMRSLGQQLPSSASPTIADSLIA